MKRKNRTAAEEGITEDVDLALRVYVLEERLEGLTERSVVLCSIHREILYCSLSTSALTIYDRGEYLPADECEVCSADDD